MLCYVEHVPMTCKYLQWPFSVWCFFKVWRVWFRRQPDHIDPVWQVVEAGKGDRRVERDHHWHRHRLQEDQQGLPGTQLQLLEAVPAGACHKEGPLRARGRDKIRKLFKNIKGSLPRQKRLFFLTHCWGGSQTHVQENMLQILLHIEDVVDD